MTTEASAEWQTATTMRLTGDIQENIHIVNVCVGCPVADFAADTTMNEDGTPVIISRGAKMFIREIQNARRIAELDCTVDGDNCPGVQSRSNRRRCNAALLIRVNTRSGDDQ